MPQKAKSLSLKKLKSTNTISIFLSLIAVVLLSSLFLGRIIAQQTPAAVRSLEVSPPSQELSADPGQTITAKAKVINKNSTALNFDVKIEDFTASGEGGQIDLTDKGANSIATWTKVDPAQFTLGPGETKEVVAQISVPKNAAGGYYGSFVFTVNGGTPGANSAVVNQQIASLFLIRVSGPVNEQLSLTSFRAPSFVEVGPVSFGASFKNSGNVHVKPHGLINVSGPFGKEDVVFAGENVFPGASRSINVQLNKKFLIGPYTATAVFYYGDKNDTLTATTSFFAFPVRLFTVLLIVVVILLLLRKRLTRALSVLFG